MRRDPDRHGVNVGWLFADLLLALTVIFLVANASGTIAHPPTPPTPTPTATLIPTPTLVPTPPPLVLHPITLQLTVDPSGLLSTPPNPNVIAQAMAQVKADPQLRGKRAGLVLTFGGASNAAPGQGITDAQAFDSEVLTALGKQNYVFINTVYREFFTLGADPSNFTVDVYVYKT